MSVLQTSKNPGGREELFNFTQGIEVDKFLCRQEIKVQKAWVESLVQIGVLSEVDGQKAHSLFDEALKLMEQNEFPWKVEDEDIHMNLERFITERAGELGKQIHWGRSRNDLIATTLRLFVNDNLKELEVDLSKVITTLCEKAKQFLEQPTFSTVSPFDLDILFQLLAGLS